MRKATEKLFLRTAALLLFALPLWARVIVTAPWPGSGFPSGPGCLPAEAGNAPVQTAPLSPADDVSDILAMISLDSLVQTVRDLTGESWFILNGNSYNLQTRYVYSPQIDIARDYLFKRLERLGYEPVLQSFTHEEGAAAGGSLAAAAGGTVPAGAPRAPNLGPHGGRTFTPAVMPNTTFYNVIAVKTGTRFPDTSFIICAHYDAINQNGSNASMARSPGADDNASGTAAVLEAARVLADKESDYTIKFILFSAEEIGLLGSWVYASKARDLKEDIAGVINLDMIGWDGDGDGRIDLHTDFVHTALVDSMRIWALTWDLGLTAQLTRTRGNSDHAPFMTAGYPAMMLIEHYQDFNPNYHTSDDLLQYMNSDFFLANSRLAAGTLARFAGVSSATAVEDKPQARPESFVLHEPWPNPFNPSLTAGLTAAAPARVTLDVIDLRGRLVKTLYQGRLEAGYHEFSWHGRTETGARSASGIYFIRFRTDGRLSGQKKVVLLR